MKIFNFFKKEKTSSLFINILNNKHLTKEQKERITKIVLEEINLGKELYDIAEFISERFNLGLVQMYRRANRIDIVI